MKYVPTVMSLPGELSALQKQSFSSSIMPFIQIIKDKKTIKGKASVLNDIENLIKSKSNITFFITVPRNLTMTDGKLKPTVKEFFRNIDKDSNYHLSILNKFTKFSNVIPVIEVDLNNYKNGDLTKLKNKLSNKSNTFCYRIDSGKLNTIKDELSKLITKDDYLLYDLGSKTSPNKNEINTLKKLKNNVSFKSIVIKQPYKNLTFSKFPNQLINSTHKAFDCIDFDFYKNFKNWNFDYFGDWAGIRNIPIYNVPVSYPSYLTIELDNFNHHAFKGIAKKPLSFNTVVLKKYTSSPHWLNKIDDSHKHSCYGCTLITQFNNKSTKVNNATKWKTATISHFLSAMDYKINNSII